MIVGGSLTDSESSNDQPSRLPCYVFCICLLTTNKYQKYKSVELGDQLVLHKAIARLKKEFWQKLF